jgi:hypothetical protein
VADHDAGWNGDIDQHPLVRAEAAVQAMRHAEKHGLLAIWAKRARPAGSAAPGELNSQPQQPVPVVLVNNDKGIPGPDPAPYSRVELERVGTYLAKGKSARWLDQNGIISRYRLRAARERGVRWGTDGRLELPRGTRTTRAGDVILPRR